VRVEHVVAQHSADRAWWWNGSQWHPAWSADRQSWFDGAVWRPANVSQSRRPLTRFELLLAGSWFFGFELSLVWSVIASPHVSPDDGLTGAWLWSGAVLLGTWLAGMGLSGYLLARRKGRVGLVALAFYVWLLMGVWVFFTAVTPTPASTIGDDDGAGLGMVLLAVPALLVISLLVAVGAFVGVFVTRVLGRSPRLS
jgi:hypothetical protein